jgi:hypothetical protein
LGTRLSTSLAVHGEGHESERPGDKQCVRVFSFESCGKPRLRRYYDVKGAAGMGDRRYGGISLGGIIVIVGIVVMFVWSLWIGLIIALIGLIAFGGFVRGKWY